MTRTPSCDKSGLKKGTWTPEEDRKLIAYVTRYGCWNWRQLPRFAGLTRCGKSCRLRWLNYLRPNIKRGNYTQEEEETIIKLHQQLGNRWSAIAAKLPGRTDNEIKNHWHSNLKKRFQKNSDTHEQARVSMSKDHSPIESREVKEPVTNNNDPFQSASASSHITVSGPSSPQSSSSSESSCNTTETTVGSKENTVADNDFAFLDAYVEPETMRGDFWTEPYVTDIGYAPSEILAAAPLVPQPEYFNPLWDSEFWGQNNLYDEYTGLF